LKEHGAKPVGGGWIRSSGWEFDTRQELVQYLEKVFRGFKFQQCHGSVDRRREILTFVKEPKMATAPVTA